MCKGSKVYSQLNTFFYIMIVSIESDKNKHKIKSLNRKIENRNNQN